MLHNNKLMSVPAEIGRLTSLRELTLYNNKLTSVPAEIWRLRELGCAFLDEGVTIEGENFTTYSSSSSGSGDLTDSDTVGSSSGTGDFTDSD